MIVKEKRTRNTWKFSEKEVLGMAGKVTMHDEAGFWAVRRGNESTCEREQRLRIGHARNYLQPGYSWR